jgi:hypothetical protein
LIYIIQNFLKKGIVKVLKTKARAGTTAFKNGFCISAKIKNITTII